ncbi:MAG: MBL fold metallo-hydrolase [Bacteroidales bacterium]
MHILLTGTGTSQGTPVINCKCDVCLSKDMHDKRLRTSAIVKLSGTNILIDPGPDLRQQLLQHPVEKIDAVLITHEHHDHIGGMDDLRPFFFRQKQPLDIYAAEEVQKAIKKKYYYAFDEQPYPGAPQFNLIRLENKRFSVNNHQIEPIFAWHGKMPVWGFRLYNFAYLTDIKEISIEEQAKLQNLDTLVISALHHNKHHSHLSLKEALELIQKINPAKAYLTHISHEMGKYEDVKNLLPENVFLGYDGLEISI